MPRRRTGTYARDLIDNIRKSDEPAHRKVLMTLKNRALAIGALKGCCGHPGEPGC
jgi:hypothetical protein